MRFLGAVALLLSSLPQAVRRAAAADQEIPDHDAIIVGGGPSGLSCASGLARVNRDVLLLDSGEYRNGVTRHMHDLIGFDGVTPAYFRWAARKLIAQYPSVVMKNGTATRIEPVGNNTFFCVTYTMPNGIELTRTTRKVVLGTGMRDLIPSVPGLREIWGKGAWWCPWCDGYEHKGQQLGVVVALKNVVTMTPNVMTLYSDIIVFANGSDTPEGRREAEKNVPRWEEYFKLHNIRIENRTIASFERLVNGSNEDANPAFATFPENDLFRVHFDQGPSVDRNAFYITFPSEQASRIGVDAGVRLLGNKMQVELANMSTNVPGIYAVGDDNSNDSTNLPHALWSGKRAAVSLHGQITRETRAKELAALNSTTGNNLARRAADQNPRKVWSRMNGRSSEILYAGAYDQF